MKFYLRFIVVGLVLVFIEQSFGYPLENGNDCALSPLNRPQRKADPNMALLMAFTSKNKSKLPLSKNKKSMTYKIDTSESDELQKKNKQNMKLIQSLIKNGHVEYLKMDQKTKRDNHKNHDNSNSSEDHSIESIELMRSVKSSKKSCYKDVYTNVLEAFQMALKKEIAEYKKCLCKKNKTMTTTPMATTTTSTTTPMSIEELFDNDTNDERNTDNEDELSMGRALENPSDVICMHKKYAIMLNKFLDAMHCDKDKTTTEEPSRVHESKGKEGRRHERNNEKVAQRADIVETTVSTVELKNKAKDSKDKPTEAIMQLFKQLHEFENKNKQYQSQASIVSSNNIQKRTDVDSISASEISMSNEEDEADEILNHRLLQQLKTLFQEYELSQDNGEDETFLQSNESTSGSIVQRSPKKSSRKTAVQEDSTESTEATVILKKHKNEAKSSQLKENLRKSNTSNASDSRNSIRKHSNRNDSTDDTKLRRRTSSNHKSSNDNREKLSLNVKIPKSSNILVKKIKWD